MKTIIALAGMIVLAAVIINPAFAQAEADFNVDLTEDGTGVVITGYTGSQTAVKIPAAIQGFPVTEIGNGAFTPRGWSPITSVTIPAGVTTIGGGAFFGCQSLTTITIPPTVTVIGNSAFQNCEQLAAVTFHEGLVEIGEYAFCNCPALTTVKLPNSLKTLGERAFAIGGYPAVSAFGISTLTLGTGLTEIPRQAFSGTAIKTVVIPEGITKIGDAAFASCELLTTVTLPATLTEIEEGGFQECSALTTFNIPASLTSVHFGSGVFDGCPKILLASRAALQKLGAKFRANTN